jgi:hypothetical protein
LDALEETGRGFLSLTVVGLGRELVAGNELARHGYVWKNEQRKVDAQWAVNG